MDALADLVGLTTPQLVQLLALAAVLVIGLFVLRLFLKLTVTLFRIGCVGVILIVVAVYVISLLNGGGVGP